MCWAFSLFITALWIFVTIQCILGWVMTAKAQNVFMYGPRIWQAIVKLSFAAGITAVTASITLLLVTIAQLRFNIQGEYQNPNAANWDAKLIFTITPRPSSYLAFVVRYIELMLINPTRALIKHSAICSLWAPASSLSRIC